MIPIDKMLDCIPAGLKKYLGVPVIRGNQAAPAPPYPYVTFNLTTPAGENGGTWQQHEDGIDRLMVESIWSFSTLSTEWHESMILASRAREWFEHTGRTYLSDHGITVQSTTQITNRDNILALEYERKNGFDVVFYVFDEAENPMAETGYIETAEVKHKTTY